MLAQAMNKRLKRLGKEEKGFTLIELLAVIVILGIIAVIAIPLISNIISKSKSDSDVATARQIYDASRMYIINELNGDYSKVPTTGVPITGAANSDSLQGKGYLETPIYLSSNKEAISGGTVNYTNGTFSGVSIQTTTEYTTSKPKSFTADEVLKAKATPATTTTTTTTTNP